MDLVELALRVAVVAGVHHVELAQVLDVEAVEDVARLAPDAALVVVAPDAVTVRRDGDAAVAVLAQELPTLDGLDALLVKAAYDVLRTVVAPEVAHVRRAPDARLARVHREVDAVATGVHRPCVLVHVHDVVAKATHGNVQVLPLHVSPPRTRYA